MRAAVVVSGTLRESVAGQSEQGHRAEWTVQTRHATTPLTMLTQCDTMSDLAEIKSEIGSVPEYGAAAGSVDSNSTTPQPHQNFAWVSIKSVPSHPQNYFSFKIILCLIPLFPICIAEAPEGPCA